MSLRLPRPAPTSPPWVPRRRRDRGERSPRGGPDRGGPVLRRLRARPPVRAPTRPAPARGRGSETARLRGGPQLLGGTSGRARPRHRDPPGVRVRGDAGALPALRRGGRGGGGGPPPPPPLG